MKTWQWIVITVLLALLLTGGGVAVVKIVASKTEAARLAGLLPQVRAALDKVRAELLTKHGIKTLVGETRRDQAMQDARVQGGKSATSHSWHLLGRAIDLYPYGPDDKPDLAGAHVDRFRTMMLVAGKYGFKNLAFNPDGSKRYIATNAGAVWDGGHIEYPEGMTFAQAAAAQGLVIA